VPRIGLALALAGCAGRGPTPEPGEPADGRDTPGVFGADREPAVPAYTVSRGEYTAVLPDTFASSLPGLEVLSWETADPGGRVAAAFEELDGQSALRPDADAGELSRWARSGLVLRVIPLDELPRVLGALPPVGALNRRAWGTVPQWQPAISAPERVDRMRIHDGSIDRDPGSTPRLLLRGWVEPVIEAAGDGRVTARVRAELVPQFHTPGRAAFEPVATLTRPSDQGTVLRELVLSAALVPGTALVVTAEALGEEESPEGAGPPTPRVRSLGSVLFVDRPEEDGARGGGREAGRGPVGPSRVSVLVLVPVLPAGAGEGG